MTRVTAAYHQGMSVPDQMPRTQLVARRRRLEAAAQRLDAGYLSDLLQEVDSALQRVEAGTYGLCDTCHEPIEAVRLASDPLVRFCLDHLTSEQQRALQDDLEMAARIQASLLPKRDITLGSWEIYHHYEASGPVSGDYCDVVIPEADSGAIYFLLGDVSGKGVAASMLMAHLHAIFRSLINVGLPVSQLIERANRVFCKSTLPQHFATLVCGRLLSAGGVELCNAGHCPPLVVGRSGVTTIQPAGLPLGVIAKGLYRSETTRLDPGDTIFVYTDGLSEAVDSAGAEYGAARLTKFLDRCRAVSSNQLVRACLEEMATFRGGSPMNDDLTVMAIRRLS